MAGRVLVAIRLGRIEAVRVPVLGRGLTGYQAIEAVFWLGIWILQLEGGFTTDINRRRAPLHGKGRRGTFDEAEAMGGCILLRRNKVINTLGKGRRN